MIEKENYKIAIVCSVQRSFILFDSCDFSANRNHKNILNSENSNKGNTLNFTQSQRRRHHTLLDQIEK